MFTSIAALAGLEIKDAAKRGIRFFGLIAIALVFVFGAIFFALSALRTSLALSYDPMTADLMIASGLLVVAAILSGVAFIMKSRRVGNHTARNTALIAAPIAARLAMRNLPSLIKVVPAVVIAGFLIGRFASRD